MQMDNFWAGVLCEGGEEVRSVEPSGMVQWVGYPWAESIFGKNFEGFPMAATIE